MAKVSKKLGGQHFLAAKDKLLQNDMPAVMEILLTYYDKAYLGSIEKRKEQLQLAIPWDGKNLKSFVANLIKSA